MTVDAVAPYNFTGTEKIQVSFLPSRKIVATVFWNKKGVFLVYFMEHGKQLQAIYTAKLSLN